MFIAKFSQVSPDSEKFIEDKNGVMPYIGEILAGKAKASIINGTIFEREGLKVNTLYVCETKEVELTDDDDNVTTVTNVVVLGTPTFIEYAQLRKELGEGKLVRDNVEATEKKARNINDFLEEEEEEEEEVVVKPKAKKATK